MSFAAHCTYLLASAVGEEDVVVGARAQDVVRTVWPVVQCSEQADVRGLGVGSGEAFQRRPAHLAPVVVELLYAPSYTGVPHDPQRGGLPVLRCSGGRIRNFH